MKEQFFTTVWITIIYFLLGVVGHVMAIPPGVATPVWPASGFALAIVLMFGRKAWLGIVIGAFLTTVEPLLFNADFTSLTFSLFFVGFAIGVGILLQAIFGAWIINRFLDNNIFKSPSIFLQFSVSILLMCVVSSSIGTSTLYLNESITAKAFIETWITWWLGDSVGVLLLTPLILLFFTKEIDFKMTFALVTLYLILIFSTLFSFGIFSSDGHATHALIFLSWPILLIFALKYKIIHSSLATLIVSAIAITFTYNRIGAFYVEDVNSSLLLLQIYIIATAVTTMTVVILSTQQRYTKAKLISENKERLESEWALLKLKKNLEVQVKEEVEKNRRKDQQLFQQSRLAQMGEMISMIAHQWRQPISTISMSANNILLDIELDNLDKNILRTGANNILAKTAELSQTIDDFRNFHKPNKESVLIKLEDLAEKSLNLIKPSLVNHNINIIKEYNSDEEIEIYDNEMIHVILNVLRNALDNFKEKEKKDAYIKIGIENKIISICDNGGGIPENIMEKIFDPYFSTKDEKNGTGLGLYMSKTIVEKHHHGKLTVNNTDNGVCFRIELGMVSEKK